MAGLHDARLRDGREIVAVLRAPRRRAGHLLGVHVRETGVARAARVAVVASRKVGSAVARNRAKRLLREAARRVAWRDGLDVVLVARPAGAESTLDDVLRELTALAVRLDAFDDVRDAA